MKPVSITDDRGRGVRLCAPARLPKSAPADVRRIVRAASEHLPRRVALAVGAMGLAAAASTPLFTGHWRDRVGMAIVVFGSAAAVFGLFLVSNWINAIAWRGTRARALCAQAGICPSCGYDLTGLDRQEDGCTPCPECGAAWRLPAR